MSHPQPDIFACPSADIAAYLDGELDAPAQMLLEMHVGACAVCAENVREQRGLLCELDFLAEKDKEIVLPANFTEVVTVRAQSDLRGMRNRAEHHKALRWCALLSLAAFALLGGAWQETVWQPLQKVFDLCTTLADFVARTLYQTGFGVAVLSRHVSGYLFFNSFLLSVLTIMGLVLGLFWLSRLISAYHRSHPLD